MPEPDVSPVVQSTQDTATDPGWKVVLLNDDVTPIDIVVMGLQRACGLSEEVAEMIAVEAHHEGSAVARSGLPQAEAETICARLRVMTRIPTICPGVGCHAEKDE